MKRMLAMILALALVLSMAACGGENAAETTAPTVSANTTTYSVRVQSAGGMALEGIDVYIYADSSLTDMKQYGETNEYGKVSFDLPESSSYAVVLSGAPDGYRVEASYGFSGSSADIMLTSSLIEGDLSGTVLGLGDVMYDFTVTTPAGDTVTLSEVLKEKDMVLLNFWYTTCTYCVAEFPYMEEAYQTYKDSIEVIALNPFDDAAAITSFQKDMGLSFPMAQCQASWANTFSLAGYPTSIAVDRYGVICMIEAGGITSLRPFVGMFEHFTGDDYEQKLCAGGINELVENPKPNVEMASSEEIGAAINTGDITVTYRPETKEGEAEYSWPFVITELNGEACLKASNQQVEGSFAILYADVEMKAGQALGFDYHASSEQGADVMYVIMEDDDIYQISGQTEEGQWRSCYPWVAEADGTYELALCYLKDEDTNDGDDTVYIKNMRVVDASEVDTATYLPRLAATTEDGFEYSYVEVVLNEKDGYYHVGTADGPLLLADLMGYTPFNEERSIHDICYNGEVMVDGVSMYETIVDFCSYASNSSLSGICTVNEELAQLLKTVAQQAGFSDDENEWLKICKYYQVYGSEEQLQDPILGLADFSAYKAKLGKNVATNYFYYDRPIIPRGTFAEFVPEKSGVYRITSRSESQNGVDAWIFAEDRVELFTYAHDERMHEDTLNCSMVYYMEAGTPYYINIAFWDYYETGTIPYDIEYLGKSYDLFRLCSPGYFTYDSDATGDAMYYLIHGGIDVVLGEDGYYYQDLGLDAKGNQIYGSKIYADFTGLTPMFDTPIATVDTKNAAGETVTIKGMIDKGAFDFSKSETDQEILTYMANNDGDVAATREYLKALWGESYDTYAEIYQLEDIFEGRFHGDGEDLTEAVRAYVEKIEKKPTERAGCVAVDEELATLLQALMEKFTFENVEYAWLKLCYYYDHLG